MNSGLTSRDKSFSTKGTRLILIYSCIDLPPLLLLYTNILLPSSSIFVTSHRKSACHLNTTLFSPLRTPNKVSHIPLTPFTTETTPIPIREVVRTHVVRVRERWPAYAMAIAGRKAKICGINVHFRDCV